MSARANYVIRKGGYYYRPNCQGYTAHIADAGRYTQERAEAEARVEPWHMEAICIDGMTPQQMVGGSIWAVLSDMPLPDLIALARALCPAGYRVVRDVAEVWEPMQKTEVHWAEQQPDGIRRVAKAEGWNACRRAMLAAAEEPPHGS